MKQLIRSKTFWSGVGAIVTAVGCYFTGEINLADTIQTVAIGLIGIFLRHGMDTSAVGGDRN